MSLRVDDFDYTLPDELIAQSPASERHLSRLLVLDRAGDGLIHDRFFNLGQYLRSGDLLVANRSRVLHARLRGRRPSGGAVELLLLRRCEAETWQALARPSKRLRPGMVLEFGEGELRGRLIEARGEGEWLVAFDSSTDPAALRQVGELPLPPYIHNREVPADRYQTIYGDREGSVAAPTAGLHFTPALVGDLERQGVDMVFVTLHVGLGTFRPVAVDHVEDHRMHAEWGEVTPEVVQRIETARTGGGRVVAVGTTTVRVLEAASAKGNVEPYAGDISTFIYPGYRFRAIDGLITNFHLPRSTLLMLVSAFAGRERILDAYSEAVEQRYRFYSFGDAMLIL